MPQTSKKSIGYRSFITCDDPKGVVECGTIRISKLSSQKRDHKSEDQRKEKSLNTSLGEKEGKKEMDIGGITRGGGGAQSPTSLQLLQVSRGAEKLNHVTSSWSNRRSHDERSKEGIAQDLLKGALDLRQSLAVLSRLQKASNGMTGLTSKQKQSVEGRGVNDMGIGVMDLNQLKDEMHHMEVQKPRLSVDRSSRHSYEEVKRVIRQTLVRQHDPVTEDFYDSRKLDSSDIPSTSSSQSTVVGSSDFPSSESSLSSTASRKKAKRSNLMARLMGLESMPSSPRKNMGNEKFPGLRKPVLDADLPLRKNPELATQMVDRQQSTLDEILETMKFKGLLKSNSLNGISPNSQQHEALDSKRRWIDDKPPIVIMKPRRISCASVEQPVMPEYKADAVDELLKKLRSRREPQPKVAYREVSNSNEKSRDVKAIGTPIQNLYQGGGAHSKEVGDGSERRQAKTLERGFPGNKKASVNLYQKPQTKQTALVQKTAAIRKKGEEMKITKPGTELKCEDQAILAAFKLKKPKDGVSVKKSTICRPASKCETQKASDSSSNRRRIRQSNEKTVVEKPTSTDARGSRNAKEEFHDPSENDSVHPTAETLVAEQISGDGVDPCHTHIKGYDDESLSKDASMAIHEDSIVDHQNDNLSSLPEIIIPIDNEGGTPDNSKDSHCSLCEDLLGHIYVGGTSGQHEGSQSSPPEIMLPTSVDAGDIAHLNGEHSSSHAIAVPDENEGSSAHHHEDNTEEAEIGSQNVDQLTPTEVPTATGKLKAVLLSSPSFMNRADELFYLKANLDIIASTTNDGEPDAASTKVLLDCAIELMELKSSQYIQARMPLRQCYRTNSKNYIYLDQLLKEICEGIEALKCYSEPGHETLPNDSLSMLLDRDLRCTGMASGTWDIGWRNAFSVHEVEEIVSEIDKLVLAGLIVEVLEDFLV
ncbi:hypothetical protein Ancab_028750 [Ancistrocladus abbreviatus]